MTITNKKLSRRQVILSAAALPLAAAAERTPKSGARKSARLLFTSSGKTAVINSDGAELRYLEFDVKDQVTWQPGPFLSDGRVVFLSMEQRRDGPGRPFDEYYTQTPTHLWLYDLDRRTLKEIATRDRLAVFYTPAVLVSDERILVQVVRNTVGQIFSMNLDGTDAKEFTKAGEGLPYGLSLSPDRKRVAFHLASPTGYQIWTSNTEGGDRVKIAAHPDHLYFGTSWSPDGKWVLFQDCLYKSDPGHDWSDVCIGRADGSEHRVLTSGRPMWFAATYGNEQTKGGGSNMPAWTLDGKIVFPCRLPGSVLPWQYRVGEPDTDHFNRKFNPAEAKGGTEICFLDPHSGKLTQQTQPGDRTWDFRATPSPDGKQLAFCRAKVGEPPALWVMDMDGRHSRRLTGGLNGSGADHPRWVPSQQR